MSKCIAIYVRVSSKAQKVESQLPDLERWAASQSQPVRFFSDKATGKNMVRPAWQKVEEAIRLGRVPTLVVWRIDRLGRTASGLASLFDLLQAKRVNLISIRDGLDLSTPAGRLMANVLASIAQFETEVRGERVAAGQAAARARGVRWGGSEPGIRKKVQPAQEVAIKQLHADGEKIARIARAVGLSRPTIYSVLQSV